MEREVAAPGASFVYLCVKTGRFDEVVQLDSPAHYPSISEKFFGPGEGPLPRFDVGDIYLDGLAGRPPTVLATAEQAVETAPSSER